MLKHVRKKAPQADETSYILEKRAGSPPNEPGEATGTNSGGGGDGNGGGGRKSSISQEAMDCQEGGKSVSGGGASALATTFNYVNSIIGSGIIGMPFALREAGMALGIATLCVTALFIDRSLVLLVKNGNLSGTSTYQDMVLASFGFTGYAVLTLFQFVYPFIAMISYNVIVGDTIIRVLVRSTGLHPESFFARREVAIAITTVVVTLPLSLYKEIGKLAKVSLLSLVFVVFIAACVFVRFFTMAGQIPDTGEITYFNFHGYSQAFGIMTFAYMCHHNSFLLYSALEGASQQRWDRVTHLSVFSSFLAMLAFAVGGYVTFLEQTQGDLLNNYCWSDDLMNVCRLLFAATIMLTYPIECFVCREVMENILFQRMGLLSGGGKGEESDKWKNSLLFSHVAITIGVVALCFAISLSTDCLGLVLVLNGLYFAVPLAYVLPGACYLKLSWGKGEGGFFGDWNRLVAVFLVVFGISATIHGTVMLVTTGPSDCYHDIKLPYCQEDSSRINQTLPTATVK